MKQTAKRILSFVLTFVMLVSMMTVFTFAANNYVPDDEYYDRIMLDSVVVNPEWKTAPEKGEKVSYQFRGETVTETYDENIHFGTIQAAFDASVKAGNKNPVIILVPGTYLDAAVITDNVTILGPNAGIDPNVKPENELLPWTENEARGPEAVVKGVIAVKRTIKTDLEVKFDGVTLFKGFSYMETGNREKNSIVYCENTIINGAGNASYGNYSATDVFSFSNSSNTVNTVNIKNCLVKNMSASNVCGVGVSNFNAESVMFTQSQGALLGTADAPTNQEPNYLIKDCMFYNNNATLGVISVDHSQKDNATRTVTNVEVDNCWFIDGPDTKVTVDSVNVSPIYATVVGPKNNINVHDCYFEGKTDYKASVLSLSLTTAAQTAEFKNGIKFNNNVMIGYTSLPNTKGMTVASSIDFTGNYFANAEGMQTNPVFPNNASVSNVYMDYYYINEGKTIKSTIFEMKSLGITGADIDHKLRTASVLVGFDKKIPVNIEANESTTTFKVYSDAELTKEVTEFDTSKFESGINKNVFYAVSTSSRYPSYSSIYTVYITTFDPSYAVVFDKKNTYLLTEEVKGLAKGTPYFNVWDGVSYQFTAGVNAFATSDEVFAVAGDVPTIIIPAGTYSQPIYATRSAVILGAKHGINPNIPDFENPDVEWRQNPERSDPDQETIIENAVIAFTPDTDNNYLVVDGFTLGVGSGYADRNITENYYTSSSIENCIVDGAFRGNFIDKKAGTTSQLGSVISVGTNTDSSTNHKSLRIINLRMENQPNAILLGSYMEYLYMDGCYVAKNPNVLMTNEFTAPKDQDFHFEMRNCCFYKNVTTTYYFIVNSAAANSSKRERHAIIFHNNTFYETNSNANGIFGIRWSGKNDYNEFTNNNFISSTATAFVPGYENWFIGNCGYKASQGMTDFSALEPITRDRFIVKNNRFIGKTGNSTPNTAFTSLDTCLDYSQNYCATSYGKTVAGKKITVTDTTRNRLDSYYADYAMTTLVDATTDGSGVAEFNKELDYEFYNADKASKTFKDTVSATTGTYEFKYELNTFQASAKIFTDKACTKEVTNPVTLGGGDNVFYVKFASHDGSVADVYTATVTKPASTGAKLEKFGNWKISGSSVFACVPTDSSVFAVPSDIVVSVGAKYALYNDADCVVPFTANKITVPENIPVQKFIKVVSQDGKTTNVYALTVLRAVNDQAELTAVAGGTKTSDTSFLINTNNATVTLVPEISDGATVKVFDGNEELRNNGDGSFTVENVVTTKTVKVVVKAALGAENTFTVEIVKGLSSAAVESVRNMYSDGGDKSAFKTFVQNIIFEVVPTLASDKATFKLYNDRACTSEIKGTTVVLTKRTTDVYMKVTSGDGSETNVVKLSIESGMITPEYSAEVQTYYEIKDATLNEGTKNHYTIVVPAGTKEYTLNLNVVNESLAPTTYVVATDSNYSTKLESESPINTPIKLKLTGRNTTVYSRIYVKNATNGLRTDNIIITIVCPQSEVKYSDDSAIAAWAKDEINYLNEQGFGYFVGDEKGNFNPTAGISRFEVAVVVSKILGVNPETYGVKHVSYVDNVPNWAKPYVNAVTELGIMAGKSTTTFNGADATTRQEFARIISSTLALLREDSGTLDEIYTKNSTVTDFNYSQVTFADEASVANWAKVGFKLAVGYYKVMSGSADGGKLYLNPTKPITRQEVAVLVANLSGYQA